MAELNAKFTKQLSTYGQLVVAPNIEVSKKLYTELSIDITPTLTIGNTYQLAIGPVFSGDASKCQSGWKIEESKNLAAKLAFARRTPWQLARWLSLDTAAVFESNLGCWKKSRWTRILTTVLTKPSSTYGHVHHHLFQHFGPH